MRQFDIMNNYHAVPAAGTSVLHTTRTSSGVQFEQGQGTSVAEFCSMLPVAGSNVRTIKKYT